MNLKFSRNAFLVSAAACAIAAFTANAQPQKSPTADQFVGAYKGTAKMDSGEMDVAVEIAFRDGKVSGRAVTANMEYKIASGKMEGAKLTIKFGTDADAPSLTLQQTGDKLVGGWIRGTQKGTVELKKVTAQTSVDEISGEWDGVADAQGQPFPFTLSLKLDREKVTGSSSSQLGTSSISTGTWKDGKLAFVLEGGSGQIAMVATMIEGKLSGDYDFAGQTSGRWVAIKKK